MVDSKNDAWYNAIITAYGPPPLVHHQAWHGTAVKLYTVCLFVCVVGLCLNNLI